MEVTSQAWIAISIRLPLRHELAAKLSLSPPNSPLKKPAGVVGRLRSRLKLRP